MAQLIMVEGIPGSGKSTTAHFIKSYLENKGEEVALYQEGDLDHPADFERVSYVTAPELENLLNRWPDHKESILEKAVKETNGYLLSYGKLAEEKRHTLPNQLINELIKYDIYEGKLSAAQYQDLLHKNWQRFADFHGRESGVIIFECCFLQNPLCALFARFNLGAPAIEKHILNLEEAVEGLRPLLIYLDAKDTKGTLGNVSKERSQEWQDFIIRYHTGQGYGKQQNVEGFDGLVKVMEARQKIERGILNQLDMPVLKLSVTEGTWEDRHEKIQEFIDIHHS